MRGFRGAGRFAEAYPDLVRAQPLIEETLKLEETRFRQTLDRGLRLLGDETKKLGQSGTLPGEVAFKLYDTYGFPLDLTQLMAEEKGLVVDTQAFERLMAEQKDRARGARKSAAQGAADAGTGAAFAETHALPVINSSNELGEWDHLVQTSGFIGGCGIHVDTGMNRLGLTIDETAAVAARMQTENHGMALLMSHFACSDRPENPLNDQQIRQFREIRVLFRGIASSLANSGGIFLDKSAFCDLVRPGIALYGGTMLEGAVGTMASAQLFATFTDMSWGTELFGPLLLTEEILREPLMYRDFALEIPRRPGLGIDIDEDKLARMRRDR